MTGPTATTGATAIASDHEAAGDDAAGERAVLGPIPVLRSLAVAFATSARREVSNRGGLVFTAVFYTLVTWVLAALWRTGIGEGRTDVAGYSAAALTWYIGMSEGVTVCMRMRLIADVGDEIIGGSVAVEMLRPASVLGQRLAIELGAVLPKLVVTLSIGLVLSLAAVGAPISVAALLLAVPSAVLAVMCNLVAQHAFVASVFWLRHAGGAWFLYQKLIFVLGGMLLPLEVLPDSLETVARWLPFRAMAYAPARIASGHIEPSIVIEQLLWLGLLLALAVRAFSAGERRLQVVGG